MESVSVVLLQFEQEGEKYANNFVSTTKYTMITFLPHLQLLTPHP